MNTVQRRALKRGSFLALLLALLSFTTPAPAQADFWECYYSCMEDCTSQGSGQHWWTMCQHYCFHEAC